MLNSQKATERDFMEEELYNNSEIAKIRLKGEEIELIASRAKLEDRTQQKGPERSKPDSPRRMARRGTPERSEDACSSRRSLRFQLARGCDFYQFWKTFCSDINSKRLRCPRKK